MARFFMFKTTGIMHQHSDIPGEMAVAVPRCSAEHVQDWTSQKRVNRQTSLGCSSFYGKTCENSKSEAIMPGMKARNNFATYKGSLASRSRRRDPHALFRLGLTSRL